ncbi:MAG: DUF4331 domain-containing protein [Mastigocoleus sp.]
MFYNYSATSKLGSNLNSKLGELLNSPSHPSQKYRGVLRLGAIALGVTLVLGGFAGYTNASDHDDGEVDTKGRNLNLTDLYVFRDGDQNPQASKDDLVLIMNTNPRSVARQQYYFSNRARYEFNISRLTDNEATPTGKPDVKLRFEFSAPNKNQEQEVKITAISNNGKHITRAITTPLNSEAKVQQVSLGNSPVQFFAGLREDPFFFDVEQFFRVRAGALGKGPVVGFREPSKAIDFAKGYNVNAIAIKIPIKFLQGKSSATSFDIWQTISVPTAQGKFKQVERLARPGINEGLIVTNNSLNALNSVSPKFEANALAGKKPAAKIAAPIFGEAIGTLKALGNSDERTKALVGAFLPDVMRIDTTAESGYGKALNKKGSPIRGRLLKDDVIDTTLSVLTDGKITGDNVSYEGTPDNPSQGHSPLVPKFPYLALPN